MEMGPTMGMGAGHPPEMRLPTGGKVPKQVSYWLEAKP